MKIANIYFGDDFIASFSSDSLEYIWDVVNLFLSKGDDWAFDLVFKGE